MPSTPRAQHLTCPHLPCTLPQDAWGADIKVAISGLTNTYASYVTTWEEYQVQRYEGASTLYGPHTLDAYIQVGGRGQGATCQSYSALVWSGVSCQANGVMAMLMPVPANNARLGTGSCCHVSCMMALARRTHHAA